MKKLVRTVNSIRAKQRPSSGIVYMIYPILFISMEIVFLMKRWPRHFPTQNTFKSQQLIANRAMVISPKKTLKTLSLMNLFVQNVIIEFAAILKYSPVSHCNNTVGSFCKIRVMRYNK